MAYGTIFQDTFEANPGALTGRAVEVMGGSPGSWDLITGTALVAQDGAAKFSSPAPSSQATYGTSPAVHALASQFTESFATATLSTNGDEVEICFVDGTDTAVAGIGLRATASGVTLFSRSKPWPGGVIYTQDVTVAADETTPTANMPFGTYSLWEREYPTAYVGSGLWVTETVYSIFIGGVEYTVGGNNYMGANKLPRMFRVKGSAELGYVYYGNGDGYAPDPGPGGITPPKWWTNVKLAYAEPT